MRAGIGRTSVVSVAAVAAFSAIAQTAAAQDSGAVGDYQLPAPAQTSRPTVQGPVDPENPLGVPARTPTPTVTPTPAPTITPPPPSAATPSRAAPPRTPARTSAPAATRPVREAPATAAVPEATASRDAGPATAEPVPDATAPSTDIAAPRDLPPARDDSRWLIPGLAGAALVVGGAVLFLRRRRTQTHALEEAVPTAAPPAPTPPPPAPVPLRPAQPAAAPRPPEPAPEPAMPPAPLMAEPLALDTVFTARAVRLSLVYATLQYELEIANPGTEPLPVLQVRADLASAHGSIGTREQLAPAPQALELQHSVAALAPGESTTLKGEVRVPLQQIVPVTKGNARFLVPLVRFCLLGPDGAAVRRVFTAGPHDPGSNAIASIRLDAGPRNLRDLTAREIEAARSFALDPVGAHG